MAKTQPGVLFARIGPKTGPEQFFRCGIAFSRAWQRVEVDKATAGRLHAEQMLEVTDEQPEDYEEPAQAAPQVPQEPQTPEGGEGDGSASDSSADGGSGDSTAAKSTAAKGGKQK